MQGLDSWDLMRKVTSQVPCNRPLETGCFTLTCSGLGILAVGLEAGQPVTTTVAAQVQAAVVVTV